LICRIETCPSLTAVGGKLQELLDAIFWEVFIVVNVAVGERV